jgi:hypothetical protein
MPFTLSQFTKLRPYLFHLTAASNIGFLKKTLVLFPALSLFG